MEKVSQRDLDRRWKLKEADYRAIIERRLAGATQKEISDEYGIHQSSVSRLVAEYLKSQNGEDKES